MAIEERLLELGIVLPVLPAPIANYVPAIVHGGNLIVSGQLPRDDNGIIKGQLGGGASVEDASQAARVCAIAILSVAREALAGDLERIERCLFISGYVNAAPSFELHPQVMNGASDLLVEIFGENGRHGRAAVGVASLPMGAVVEISAQFAIRD